MKENTTDILRKVETLFISNNQQKRFEHICAVTEQIDLVAKKYNLDRQKCYIAAVLHDISTLITPEDMLLFAKNNNWELCEAEEAHPFLLHQRISEVIAREDFGITDCDILEAIAFHTSLCENPSPYQMALFVADKLAWSYGGLPPYYEKMSEALNISLEASCHEYVKYMENEGKMFSVHVEWVKAVKWLNFFMDFDYLYNALKTHPSFCIDKEMAAFEKLYGNLQSNIVDYTSFISAMTELTTFFEDGHTNIEIPYTTQDYCLKISCKWRDNRLVLKEDYKDIKAGTEIIAIEGQSVKQILERMSKWIPHENIFLVKSRMIEYPYMNYHIFSKMNLTELFGDKQNFEITFLVEGTKLTKQCVLTKYDGFLDFSEGNSVYYEIQDDKAVLHLDACICDKQYTDTLNELATLCNEEDIEMLEIDLSKNMGGSSAVIDEFIKYVDIDSFRRYEMIDYSSGNPRIITSREDIICNIRKDALFPKKIICKVSNTTFSSARTFAVTLKDNGIATIVGCPTGGKPCSYGMPRRDVTPNYNIKFRVSRALFLRPDEKLDKEVALFPDDKCIGI